MGENKEGENQKKCDTKIGENKKIGKKQYRRKPK